MMDDQFTQGTQSITLDFYTKSQETNNLSFNLKKKKSPTTKSLFY